MLYKTNDSHIYLLLILDSGSKHLMVVDSVWTTSLSLPYEPFGSTLTAKEN